MGLSASLRWELWGLKIRDCRFFVMGVTEVVSCFGEGLGLILSFFFSRFVRGGVVRDFMLWVSWGFLGCVEFVLSCC